MSTQPEETAFPWDDVGPHAGLTKREYIAVEMMKKSLDEVFARPNFSVVKFNPVEAANNALILTDVLIHVLNEAAKK